jgi:hypothetical protein
MTLPWFTAPIGGGVCAPLVQPLVELVDLGLLGGLDLLGRVEHTPVDGVLCQDGIGHLDELFVVRQCHLREHHVERIEHGIRTRLAGLHHGSTGVVHCRAWICRGLLSSPQE